MQKRTLTLWLTLMVLLMAGCSSPTPEATPTPTRTAIPVVTPIPLPTVTATPAAVAQEATPFPLDVDPLTGLKVEDPGLLEHSPLAIKVSNSPEVRPQSGLSSADLVFEHFAEGGITRFTAVFYGKMPERVGSVRSGRLIDLEIPAMYQAVFSFSGASSGVKDQMRASDLFPNQIVAPDFGVGEPYFYRVPREGVAFEHTLFADPESLHELAAERGVDKRPDFPSLMRFSEALPQGVGMTDITYFEVNYLTGTCTAEWRYDSTKGAWLRSTVGQPHTDYLTGEQLAFPNVIVLYANHVETDILEDTWGGGHMSIQIQVWGSNQALVFRDGKMLQGYWKREARNDMLTFWDGAGNPLPLKPGSTWFQVVPLDTQSEQLQQGQLKFTP